MNPFYTRELTLSTILKNEKVYAIDCETYWAKGYDMSNGVDAYVNDPQFQMTVFSFFNEEEKYSGDPIFAPVSKLHGAIIFAHNAQFDQACVERAIETHQIPYFKPKLWVCTMHMAKFFGYPGALDKVANHLLGQEISKAKREESKGWTKEQCLADKGFVQYCQDDSSTAYWIGTNLSIRYPAFEERVSRLTRKFAKNGIGYSPANSKLGQEVLQVELDKLCHKMPWDGPSLSLKEFGKWCAENGVEKPETTNAKDARHREWASRNPEGAVVTSRMSLIRKLRKMIATLKSLDLRVRPDRRISTPLNYWGAHTGRFSGTQGVNFQGLAKKELMGVNVMGFFIPAKDHVFIQFDFANIEPRILLCMVGDDETLELIRSGQDIYEAHARMSGLYSGEEPLSTADPELRQVCKARVLGLGYGCGAKAFKDVASNLTGGKLNLTDAQAQQVVRDYRKQNPKIVEYWNRLETKARECTGYRRFELPSGRDLRFNVIEQDPLTVEYVRGKKKERTWGSKLCENMIQAIARDVLADALVHLDEMGMKVLLHVHDSVVIEVHRDDAQDAMARIKEGMTRSPNWLPNLPLEIDIRRNANGL